jgi:hypothetical protein
MNSTIPTKINTTSAAFNLVDNALLIRMTIRQWSGKSKDLELASVAAHMHGAVTDAVDTYTAALEKIDREPIAQVVNEARNWMAQNTHQWDAGSRIVLTTDYERVRSKLDSLKAQFYERVNEFLNRRDELARKAEQRLGSLFKGFPERYELEGRYEFTITRLTLARTDDIRLRHVDGEAIKEIEREMERQYGEKVSEATRNLIGRLRIVLSNFSEAMGKSNTKWHDTIVSNVTDLLAIVPALNLGGDPSINALARRIGEDFRYSAEELRSNPELRAEAQQKVASIADAIRAIRISDDI